MNQTVSTDTSPAAMAAAAASSSIPASAGTPAAAAAVVAPASYYRHRDSFRSSAALAALAPDHAALAYKSFLHKDLAPAAMRLHRFNEPGPDAEPLQAEGQIALMCGLRSVLHGSNQTLLAHQMDMTLNVNFDRDYFLTLLSYAPFVGEAANYWLSFKQYALRSTQQEASVAHQNKEELCGRALRYFEQLHWWIALLYFGALMDAPRPIQVKQESGSSETVAAAASTSVVAAAGEASAATQPPFPPRKPLTHKALDFYRGSFQPMLTRSVLASSASGASSEIICHGEAAQKLIDICEAEIVAMEQSNGRQ